MNGLFWLRWPSFMSRRGTAPDFSFSSSQEFFRSLLGCLRSRASCRWSDRVQALGAPAQVATVMLGGMVFSTAAALTVLPVLIARTKPST